MVFGLRRPTPKIKIQRYRKSIQKVCKNNHKSTNKIRPTPVPQNQKYKKIRSLPCNFFFRPRYGEARAEIRRDTAKYGEIRRDTTKYKKNAAHKFQKWKIRCENTARLFADRSYLPVPPLPDWPLARRWLSCDVASKCFLGIGMYMDGFKAERLIFGAARPEFVGEAVSSTSSAQNSASVTEIPHFGPVGMKIQNSAL